LPAGFFGGGVIDQFDEAARRLHGAESTDDDTDVIAVRIMRRKSISAAY
jgi:hypothetical protein